MNNPNADDNQNEYSSPTFRVVPEIRCGTGAPSEVDSETGIRMADAPKIRHRSFNA